MSNSLPSVRIDFKKSKFFIPDKNGSFKMIIVKMTPIEYTIDEELINDFLIVSGLKYLIILMFSNFSLSMLTELQPSSNGTTFEYPQSLISVLFSWSEELTTSISSGSIQVRVNPLLFRYSMQEISCKVSIHTLPIFISPSLWSRIKSPSVVIV